MTYATLSGFPAMKSLPESYMALMCVTTTPRVVCTLKRNSLSATSPDILYLHGGDKIDIEDMTATLRFVVALVKHGGSIQLVNTDALTFAIALQVSMKSTNTELQELIAKLRITMIAEAQTGTGVNKTMFDKAMIKTFHPVSLANATSITITLTQF